ncbi:helix-turn-helix transcriptional regulator [Clostridium phoceensis]|uniref:helix-turn-helix domain-containing protein n=2 Tax=Clostridium phoceensis TaxID=1650661 RepID=UPI002ECA71B9|nr:helix-turn-helix transcriptional regulator [Eubacteriales bacterium]
MEIRSYILGAPFVFGTCYVILYRGILYPSRGKGKKMEILGARLKILRNEAGKTQQGMADFLGCQVRHYQLIEAGGSNLPIPKLMKVADYFGVSVDYLLGRTENREINR